jgi:3-deoxy-manno-octulosonate cytidylyltransferase (CMP-KDO synthetase)
MPNLGIIPARFASTRFPGKPLTIINGKSMIRRVYEQASKSSSLTKVVVATDDERIKNEVENFGGAVMRTSKKHRSGTDRCGEVVEKLKGKFDVIVNIQGDEPFIDPAQIDSLTRCFENEACQIATLAIVLKDEQLLFSPNTPKVVFNKNREALYFSRHPLPYLQGIDSSKWTDNHTYYKHIGIYAFRSEVLKRIVKLEPTALEKAESLEQLRWLENGYKITVIETKIDTVTVDTPEDLTRL